MPETTHSKEQVVEQVGDFLFTVLKDIDIAKHFLHTAVDEYFNDRDSDALRMSVEIVLKAQEKS